MLERESSFEGTDKNKERGAEKKTLMNIFTQKYPELSPEEIDKMAEQALGKIETEAKEFEDNVNKLTIEARQDPEGFEKATEEIHDLAHRIILLKDPEYGIKDILQDKTTEDLLTRIVERKEAYKRALAELEAEKVERAAVQG